jgi:hypothetical protein
MSELLEEIIRIEETHGIPLCAHNYYGKITIYRVVKETGGDPNEPIPENVINEITAFLAKYFSPKIEIKVSKVGFALKEINQKQADWNTHCDMFNICNG